MSNSNRMNVFLQKMLRRSDEELNVKTESEMEGSRQESPKGGWIKKLGNCSPRKYKVPSSPLKLRTMKSFDSSGIPTGQENTPPRASIERASTALEMPDLESIIREFETGFLSPTKHELHEDVNKQRNFVKKIVAAFEVKYKTYNELRAEEERNTEGDTRDGRLNSVESPKRRSGIFFSPFKAAQEDTKNIFQKLSDLETPSPGGQNSSQDESGESGIFSSPGKEFPSPTKNLSAKRRSRIFSSPTKSVSSETDERRSSGVFSSCSKGSSSKESETSRISGIFSSPFAANPNTPRHLERRSIIYRSPVSLNERGSSRLTDSSSEGSSVFRFDEDDARLDRRSGLFFNPFESLNLDDTKSVEGIDLDVTLPEPEETILLDDDLIEESDLTIDIFTCPDSDGDSPPRPSADKTPKIVGAFLKRPIEVENTSIEWIPITGKKLPRKKSLKKLLCLLTGKKSFEKKSRTLFSSQRQLNEESRELQDSGYDEKSCSSSSLNSLISITDVLLQQENSYVEPERRTTTLRTFKSQESITQDERKQDEAFSDAYCEKGGKKRLILREIPRESIKLELGPSYPSASKIVTMSLDRRAPSRQRSEASSPKYVPMTRIPKHPFLSNIPKHPFVSMTKMDEILESPHKPTRSASLDVDFHRSCEEIRSCRSNDTSTYAESNYDVPRRFLSKSESGIAQACESFLSGGKDEPVYDVPKSNSGSGRPRSSVYEDALSLKRRSACLPVASPPDFYAFASEEPHYATVKPRNRRIYLSEELLKSTSDLRCIEKFSSF